MQLSSDEACFCARCASAAGCYRGTCGDLRKDPAVQASAARHHDMQVHDTSSSSLKCTTCHLTTFLMSRACYVCVAVLARLPAVMSS
jgi:hypothetical protein